MSESFELDCCWISDHAHHPLLHKVIFIWFCVTRFLFCWIKMVTDFFLIGFRVTFSDNWLGLRYGARLPRWLFMAVKTKCRTREGFQRRNLPFNSRRLFAVKLFNDIFAALCFPHNMYTIFTHVTISTVILDTQQTYYRTLSTDKTSYLNHLRFYLNNLASRDIYHSRNPRHDCTNNS